MEKPTLANETYTLNTGQKMPVLGYGTWQAKPGEVQTGVLEALRAGYRLLDCAYCYGNEDEVGEALAEALAEGVVARREDVFVVTKVWATYAGRPEECLDRSLKSLRLEYVDLVLVHWPIAMNPNGNHEKFPTLPDGSRDIIRSHNHVDTWKLMEKLPATGKTKAIGVSNYSKRYLEQLLPAASIVPAVNQIENHPGLPQDEIVGVCKANGIHVMAYSPLGSTGTPLMKAEPVVKVAEKHGVAPSTVLLSYHYNRGSTVLAKSVTPERVRQNFLVIRLDDEDMQMLNGYSAELVKAGKLQRLVYPPFGVDFGFPDKS